MRRLAIVAALVAVGPARADPAGRPAPAGVGATDLRADAPGPSIASQLDAQAASIARARSQVADKQRERERAHSQRARVAYKVLRGAGSPLAVAPAQRLAIARSRATARLLLARDRAEVGLLGAEAASLAAAAQRIAADRQRAAEPPADLRLLRPVVGAIVRRFGTLEHDRSHAVLARRGLDFEVAVDVPVITPVDGIVRYAGPIRGLDHGVVIDGGGVWVVLAKLAAPVVTTGDFVAAGQRLGQARRARVYLEVRVPIGPGGLPVDPAPYLVHR